MHVCVCVCDMVNVHMHLGVCGLGDLHAGLRNGKDGLRTLAAKPQRVGRAGRRVLAPAGLDLQLPSNGAEQVDVRGLDLPCADFACICMGTCAYINKSLYLHTYIRMTSCKASCLHWFVLNARARSQGCPFSTLRAWTGDRLRFLLCARGRVTASTVYYA